MNVLLIESNADDARLISRLVDETAGSSCRLEVVDRLATGLARLAAPGIDVVLLNLPLPDSQGLETLHRTQAQAPTVALVVLSEREDEALAVGAVRAGAQDYLLKGHFTGPGLLRALRHAVERSRMLADLRASEGRFRLLAENASDIIYRYRLRPTPGFEYVSPAATAMTGYTQEEHYQDPTLIVALVHPDDRPRVEAVLATPMPMPQALTVRWRRKDGRLIWVEQHIVPIHDEAGRLTAIEGVTRDITERQRAAETQRFLAEASRLLASSLDAEATLNQLARLTVPTLADVCFVDLLTDGRGVQRVAVAHGDPAQATLVESLRNHPPDLVVGQDPAAVTLRTGESLLIPEVLPAMLDVGGWDAEKRSLVRELRPTSLVTAALVARERRLGALCLVVTGSGRRYGLADQALVEELARRAALAIDNARLYAEAQAAVRLREEFLSIAAHELKTPLTTIKGYVQLWRRLLNPETLDRQRLIHTQGALQRQVDRLEGLVADLLDTARLQQGQLALRRQPCDLAELARQVIDRVREAPERTDRHRLVLEAPTPVVGTWDGDRLDQALTNLLGNALKYSPDGGEVRARVAIVGDWAELVVSDQGIGIARADQSRIFQPFGRAQQTGRRIEGVGLGLYITAQIIERHGGTISLESAPGQGTTFRVRLPLTPA